MEQILLKDILRQVKKEVIGNRVINHPYPSWQQWMLFTLTLAKLPKSPSKFLKVESLHCGWVERWLKRSWMVVLEGWRVIRGLCLPGGWRQWSATSLPWDLFCLTSREHPVWPRHWAFCTAKWQPHLPEFELLCQNEPLVRKSHWETNWTQKAKFSTQMCLHSDHLLGTGLAQSMEMKKLLPRKRKTETNFRNHIIGTFPHCACGCGLVVCWSEGEEKSMKSDRKMCLQAPSSKRAAA